MSPATLQVCVSGQAPVGGDRPEAIESGSERTEQESAPACYRIRTPIPPTIPHRTPNDWGFLNWFIGTFTGGGVTNPVI